MLRHFDGRQEIIRQADLPLLGALDQQPHRETLTLGDQHQLRTFTSLRGAGRIASYLVKSVRAVHLTRQGCRVSDNDYLDNVYRFGRGGRDGPSYLVTEQVASPMGTTVS